MRLHNWIQLGIIVITIVVGIILHIRYKKKKDDLDGFIGFIEECGELERLDGPDWQQELFKELETQKKLKKRKRKSN